MSGVTTKSSCSGPDTSAPNGSADRLCSEGAGVGVRCCVNGAEPEKADDMHERWSERGPTMQERREGCVDMNGMEPK